MPETSSSMSYAQALNEAKQVIIQQSNRIKADADKLRGCQQTISEQSATILDSERQIRDCEETIQCRDQQITGLQGEVAEQSTARCQAEAVIDRQGQRLTAMQTAATELEQKIAQLEERCVEHARQIEQLCTECDTLRVQLPTEDDKEALSMMATLLTKKIAASASSSSSSVSSASSCATTTSTAGIGRLSISCDRASQPVAEAA